jgi:hypothetical protein
MGVGEERVHHRTVIIMVKMRVRVTVLVEERGNGGE